MISYLGVVAELLVCNGARLSGTIHSVQYLKCINELFEAKSAILVLDISVKSNVNAA